jgi:hypothetical protein
MFGLTIAPLKGTTSHGIDLQTVSVVVSSSDSILVQILCRKSGNHEANCLTVNPGDSSLSQAS